MGGYSYYLRNNIYEVREDTLWDRTVDAVIGTLIKELSGEALAYTDPETGYTYVIHTGEAPGPANIMKGLKSLKEIPKRISNLFRKGKGEL